MFFSKTRLILAIIIGLYLSPLIAFLVSSSVLIETADDDWDIRLLKDEVAYLLDRLKEEGGEFALLLEAKPEMGLEQLLEAKVFSNFQDEIAKVGMRNSQQYVSSHNRNIALAKVMVNLKRYQGDHDTINLSKKSYRTEKWVIKITWIIAICGLIITIPFGLLVLYVVIGVATAVWFFILNRISELSNAIQGKR